jgi:hypothetical protein
MKTWYFFTLLALVQNAAGFGARLKLAQNGTTVTSTYVDQNCPTQSLTFSTTAATLATIARKITVGKKATYYAK